jgi:hypothetical protein
MRDDPILILFWLFRVATGSRLFEFTTKIGAHVMLEANRRIFLQSFVAGAGTLAASQ